jgi:predicted SAM-dependent methyltransferase
MTVTAWLADSIMTDPLPIDDPRIEQLAERLSAPPSPPPPPPVAGGRFLRAMPAWAPDRVRAIGTRVLRPLAQKKFERARREGYTRLHLGCGWVHKDGWLNIDLFATRADVYWDLRLGIPFPDDSVEAISHEHMLEHLSLEHGFSITRECLRVLRPGGVLRIGVPDAGLCVNSYAGTAAPDWAASQITGMLAVQALFYENGHRAMYDAETLMLMCRAAGFAEAKHSDWGEGWIQPSPDIPSRRGGTLYVDARKGA